MPCVWNSIGIVRSTWSGSSFCAPSIARWSACSFPLVPWWPFTHLKLVGAARRLIWYAAASSQVLLLIFVHPLSSQVFRCFVSPSIAYRESDIIVRGVVGSAIWRATVMAAISPVWLVWWVPGTLIARFSGWSSPNHTPLPLFASSLPFFTQEPSVYTIIGSMCWPRSGLGFWSRRAGSVGVVVESVSTRKHSSSVPRAVTVGLKRISSPFAIFAH